MNITWVIASDYVPSLATTPDRLKDIGPIWGSWRTYDTCLTDNVVCSDNTRAVALVNAKQHHRSNFYIHRSVQLSDSTLVKRYDGPETGAAVNDDYIAVQLASSTADVVLLLGFDFTKVDSELQHLLLYYINAEDRVQWVAVDHVATVAQEFSQLPNFACESLINVLQSML